MPNVGDCYTCLWVDLIKTAALKFHFVVVFFSEQERQIWAAVPCMFCSFRIWSLHFFRFTVFFILRKHFYCLSYICGSTFTWLVTLVCLTNLPKVLLYREHKQSFLLFEMSDYFIALSMIPTSSCSIFFKKIFASYCNLPFTSNRCVN